MAFFSSHSRVSRPFVRVCLAAVVLSLGALVWGCAARGVSASDSARATSRAIAPEPPRVLVLEPELETPIDVSTRDLAAALGAGLARQGGVVVVDASLAATPPTDPDCVSRLACLRALGREAACAYVIATTVVGLGETAMLRVRFVDVNESGGEQMRQAVVEPATQVTLAEALEDVGVVFATPFEAVRPPAFEPSEEPSRARRRWRWLGPLLGSVVVGGTTTAIVVGRSDANEPDIVIVPP